MIRLNMVLLSIMDAVIRDLRRHKRVNLSTKPKKAPLLKRGEGMAASLQQIPFIERTGHFSLDNNRTSPLWLTKIIWRIDFSIIIVYFLNNKFSQIDDRSGNISPGKDRWRAVYMQDKVTYKDSGVDIDRATIFLEKVKPLIKLTNRREVMGGIGGFSGLFHLDMSSRKDPVLVSSTDGVGTKLKIAQMINKHDTIGIDLVAMSVNDVVVQGAEPLFFLDYIATGHIDVDVSVQIINGIVRGCQEAGCALIGGETAEMPGLYNRGDYDLAGFCVGIVEADKIIDGSEIRVGDKIIGLASSGLHSNGYSLARKIIFDTAKLDPGAHIEPLSKPIGLELLEPTKIYVKSILNLIKYFPIKGIVHITGGGFLDNIPRILPSQCRAVILKERWPVPPIFNLLQRTGNIEEREMFRVFNMGIGMMVIVSEKDEADILERLEKLGEVAYPIGFIDKAEGVKDERVLIK